MAAGAIGELVSWGGATDASAQQVQHVIRWEGYCVRCGEAYTWYGSIRPIQRNCNKCQGAIVWQPVYQ